MPRIAAFALSLGVSLAFAASTLAQSVSKDPSHAPNGTYRIDTDHSQVLFSIPHLGLTGYWGRFDKISGTLNFDGNQPERSAASISIDTTSVDTPSDPLAGELKGASVFDTQQFPAATFKSTSIARTGPDTGRITGNLTIRNVTKPVTLEVTFNGSGQNPMNGTYALGFHATTTIRRSDFGLNTMAWSQYVGDDVQLVIEAMFDREKS